jgi:hypothetical protein
MGLSGASPNDWDRYVSQHWRSVHAWARANPDHLDREDVVKGINTAPQRSMMWERRYLGWAIVVAQPVQA